jgi:hypothetical protein
MRRIDTLSAGIGPPPLVIAVTSRRPTTTTDQFRRRLNRADWRAQDLGHAIDDHPGAMPLRSHYEEASSTSRARRQTEAFPLVDDRQHFAAKIDEPFEKLGRVRHARDPIRHPRHFVDRAYR